MDITLPLTFNVIRAVVTVRRLEATIGAFSPSDGSLAWLYFGRMW